MFLLAILIWEHSSRKYESNYRPSFGLSFAAKWSKDFFYWMGENFAWISSYLTHFDLKELRITLYDVFKPILDLIISPFSTITGYVCKATSYTHKGWLIYVGTFLLVMSIIFAYCRFVKHQSMLVLLSALYFNIINEILGTPAPLLSFILSAVFSFCIIHYTKFSF